MTHTICSVAVLQLGNQHYCCTS